MKRLSRCSLQANRLDDERPVSAPGTRFTSRLEVFEPRPISPGYRGRGSNVGCDVNRFADTKPSAERAGYPEKSRCSPWTAV